MAAMKRTGFWLVLALCAAVTGCQAAASTYTVVNDASVDVTVVASGDSAEYAVASGETRAIPDPGTLSLKGNPRAALSCPCAQTYRVADLQSYSCTVYNYAPVSVTLSEASGMLTATYGETLTISALNDDTPGSAISAVYTASPVFTAVYDTTGADCSVQATSAADDDGPTVWTVTIR